MLVSTYHLSDTERLRARRVWVEAQPIVVGSAADCDVVVDDPEVAPHHLQITRREGQIVVENLVDEMTAIVDEGKPVRIGGTIVKVRLQAQAVILSKPTPVDEDFGIDPPPLPISINPPGPPPPVRVRPKKPALTGDPAEEPLLGALRANPADAATRMVYADWLEQHAYHAKAELVRLREHLDTFLHQTATDVDWRAVAVRTPIDHCGRTQCPGAWDALIPTAATDFIRKCANCSRDVRYCGDRGDVRAGGWALTPVVFDAALDRVRAHVWYRNWYEAGGDDDDDIEDDPDGYTLDTPPAR